MSSSVVREALSLLAVSCFLGLTFNAVTGKGVFGPPQGGHTALSASANPGTSEIISVEQAAALYNTTAALFIDTRHAYDYGLGHIAGAMNIPMQEAETSVHSLSLPKDTTLVVYCDGAECNSSLEVGAMLVLEGYTDVRIFFSGWQSWRNSGLPVEGQEQ